MNDGHSLGKIAFIVGEILENGAPGQGGGGNINYAIDALHPLTTHFQPAGTSRGDGGGPESGVLEVPIWSHGTLFGISWVTNGDETTLRHLVVSLFNHEIGHRRGFRVYTGEVAHLLWEGFQTRTNLSPLIDAGHIEIELPPEFDVEPYGVIGDAETSAQDVALLEHISVRGLRGFREASLLQLAVPNFHDGSGLTLVVGANSAGKSTFWESFQAVSRKMHHPETVSFSEGVRNQDSPGGVCIEATWQGGVVYRLESLHGDTSETNGMWINQDDEYPPPRAVIVVPSRRQFEAHFHKNQNEDPFWMLYGEEYSRGVMQNDFTARLFARHNNDDQRDAMDDLMREILDEEFKWSIDLSDTGTYYLKITATGGSKHSSEGLGDGITSLLFIVSALVDSKPNELVVIDEPELSLHPQLLKRLLAVLARFARDRQIVIFSHSPSLVGWDYVVHGAKIARVYRREGTSVVAQPSEKTLQKVARLRGTVDWRNPHALGPLTNEVFFLDEKIIVVEGQEDVALMPVVYRECQVEQVGSFLGWGAGGAANIPALLQLLHELEFKKVVAIMDNDTGTDRIFQRAAEAFPHYLIKRIPTDDIRTKTARAQPNPCSCNADLEPTKLHGLLDEGGRKFNTELPNPEAVKEKTTRILEEINQFLGS